MDNVASQFLIANEALLQLAVALLLGALIGIERGWVAREKKSGERVAGVRTHGLVGLLGGIAALLSEEITPLAFPLILFALTLISLVAWHVRMVESRDVSITSLVGLLLTFCFGAIAVAVDLAIAAACAVVTAVILDNKSEIHGLLNKLQAHELDAGLKLLLITVVMLPLLPDRGMGPGKVLNPHEIWWMVVLIAVISFIGYFAIRVGGTEKGILFTGLFAGLSSSTALTLHFARQSRRSRGIQSLLAAGILLACATMFPRILVYAAIISPELLTQLLLPVTVMGVLTLAPALYLWHTQHRPLKVDRPTLEQNPLELRMALLFGALLALIMLLGEWLGEWLGEAGIYLLSATSGIADVNAITLSLSRMSVGAIATDTAVLGIIIAAAVNNLVKAGLAAGFGTRRLGLQIALPMIASMVAGMGIVLAM